MTFSLKMFKFIFTSFLIGIIGGICSVSLHATLENANLYFHTHAWLIWLLPFAGYISASIYNKHGNQFEDATKYLFAKLSHPEGQHGTVSKWMLPLVYGGTSISHFFGASVGRESSMIQMTVSATEQIISKIKFLAKDRQQILIASLGAGFAAAVGAPIAGFIYSVEFLKWKNLKFSSLLLSITSAAIGYAFTLIFHNHQPSPVFVENSFDYKLLVISLFFGIALGTLQFFMHKIIITTKHLLNKFIHDKKWQAAIGGGILAIFFMLTQTTDFNGLGIDVIEKALAGKSDFFTFFGKYLATALSLGTGFKGGEFVPAVYLGTSFAAAMAGLINVSSVTLASANYATMYSAAVKTPLACSILTIELFGPQIGAYAFVACFASSYFSLWIEKKLSK